MIFMCKSETFKLQFAIVGHYLQFSMILQICTMYIYWQAQINTVSYFAKQVVILQ